jgi:hypothetical protein
MIKIKLVAIARDEAAYLPEWIFHHFYFGINEIDIYVNNTLDNTNEILGKISEDYPVNFINSDSLFAASRTNFQSVVYNQAAVKAKSEGFTHVLFLDIDEFWTPADFSTALPQVLERYSYPQVLNFNWLNHCSEKRFSRCFSKEINVISDPHVKTLFSLASPWESVGVHNVLGENLRYTRADGTLYDFKNSKHKALTDLTGIQHPYFIVHRKYRSQLEYISLLGRGRANKLKIKDNRNGYYKQGAGKSIKFNSSKLNDYYNKYNSFLNDCDLNDLLIESRNYIVSRFETVKKMARTCSDSELKLFYRLFSDISLSEVLKIRKDLYKRINFENFNSDRYFIDFTFSRSIYLLIANLLKAFGFTRLAKRLAYRVFSDIEGDFKLSIVDAIEPVLIKNSCPKEIYADIYRDLAVRSYKNNSLFLAKQFIDKALELRPDGPMIKKLHDDFTKKSNEN